MMGGYVLPTASTPGYSLWRKTRHVGCDCLLEFLDVAERLGLALGLIRESLDVVQLTGDADASGGVHSLGSAFDVRQRSDAWVRLFREMGASFWPREGAAWAGNEHGHGSVPCPHDARVAYQHTAYLRGYNGLGRGPAGSPYAGVWGYGAKDTEWRPSTFRTRAQGIAWALSQIEEIQEMALTAQEIAERVWRADIIPNPDGSTANPTWGAQSYLRETFRLVERMGAQDKARDEKLSAQIGALGAVMAASQTPGLTFDQALLAAEQGAQAALDKRITSAEVVLEVSPPAVSQ